MEDHYDVIIVGGSANGAQTARSIAEEGLSVLVIEDHPEIGLPEHCSGLFSYSGLEILDSIPPDDIIYNHDIYGARLIAPNGKTLTVRKQERHALVCNRAAFDKFLIEKAKLLGAEILQPYRATDAFRNNGMIEVVAHDRSGDKISVSGKILISAEGIRGKIASKLGLSPPSKKSLVNAAQFFIRGLSDLDPQLVEVYQTQEFAKDFFGWIIPMDHETAKVGLGTSHQGAAKALEQMMQNHPVLSRKVEGGDVFYRIAGRIPVTGPVKRTYADNFLLVGDVAGQTKPTTGGGVILGGIAGRIAGKVAVEAIRAGRTDAKFLKRYEKRWKKQMYRNLFLQRKVRNYMNLLSDREMNQFFDKLEDKGLLRKIEEHGDVDNQGKLAIKLLTTFSLYPYYLRTSLKLLKAVLQK
ncbi:MAG: NAD(P)/FAD-dependent oxidoreductase [Methanobacteriota archaeon]|nr:MAG: NAD(P)/FAD-dependent oxidoreductase [Euryarchaeota archaeon]